MRVLLCVLLLVFAEVQTERLMKYDHDHDSIERELAATPEPFIEPVPFGHIPKEGFGDPFSKMKPPLDKLELTLRKPKTKAEAIELLKNDRSQIMFVNPNIPKIFASPREEFLRQGIVNPKPATNITELKWYDLTVSRTANRMPASKTPKKESSPHQPYRGDKAAYFAENSFDIISDPTAPILRNSNWTTCDEFAVKAIFSPKDIVNVKWTPFYIWTDLSIGVSVVHTFQYPTKKVVSEYRSTFGKYLNKSINWNQPKLLMKGMGEMLLIAVDKRGLFDAIFKQEMPDSLKNLPDENINLPLLTIRLKIEDPYLALTYCENHYATLMAISGNEPTVQEEMEAEAATIHFKGTGRPIWRNLRAEKETEFMIHQTKAEEELNKFLDVDVPPVPVLRGWDNDRVF